MSKKNVALVLSSGGPRGFAYIGAIEELLRRGYKITSVAGCSAGALVGGIYAAGGLDAFREWLYALDSKKVIGMLDVELSMKYLVKGQKVMNAIKSVVPDRNIEDLDIPFAAVATDLYTGEAVVFRKGNLFRAIRASISIPSMFKPVRYGKRLLVDGGLVDTFPLDIVQRNGRDILVGFDVNDMNRNVPVPARAADNFAAILSRSFSIMNHTIARIQKEAIVPDVLVNMDFDSYGELTDYARGEEIAGRGRELMAKALDEYEKDPLKRILKRLKDAKKD